MSPPVVSSSSVPRKRPLSREEDVRTPELAHSNASNTRSVTQVSVTQDGPFKKRRLSDSPVSECNDSPLTSVGDLSTPATSNSASPTVNLSLIIPMPERPNQRTLNRRRTAARKWQPKLQRPYPSAKEIKDAYPLKLMRQYPLESATSEPSGNFIKPQIKRSARVDRLLRQFPTPVSPPQDDFALNQGSTYCAPDHSRSVIQKNKRITQSEQAQRLAWECFSSKEEDRADYEREAMVESGLVLEDLVLEQLGLPNELPEWRKVHTSRFAMQ